MKLNIDRLFFPVLFLSFFSLWLILILDVILKLLSPQASLSSASMLGEFSGLLLWPVAIAAAATSFSYGLEKLGIIADLRKRIYGKDKSYEPEVFLAVPSSQPSWSSTKTAGKRGMLLEQASVSKVIIKANPVVETNEPVVKTKKTLEPEEAIMEKEKKAFYLYGDTKFEGCKHKFGYLGIHEDKPIPDECFGCSRVIECFNYYKKQS